MRCTQFASQRGSRERYRKKFHYSKHAVKTGFPSSHQLKSYVAPKSRLKLAARCPVSGCWPSCTVYVTARDLEKCSSSNKTVEITSHLCCLTHVKTYRAVRAIFPELYVGVRKVSSCKCDLFRVTQGHWHWCYSIGTYDFLLVFYCNYICVLYRSEIFSLTFQNLNRSRDSNRITFRHDLSYL